MIRDLIFFYGRVEDVNDPLQVGRVRVRIFGIHTQNKSLIQPDHLPWAHMIMDPTNAAYNGYGWSPTGIMVGSVVVGYFNDGESMQEPIVLGTYHGYDMDDMIHDVNPLARGELIAATSLKSKNSMPSVTTQSESSAQADNKDEEEETPTEEAPVEEETQAPTSYVADDWMKIAEGEIGVKEAAGNADNPRVVEYHAATSLGASQDSTPWCSAFVSWVLQQAGLQSTRSAWARSYLKWGVDLGGPAYGAVVIISRGNSTSTGHVGFVSRWDDNYVWILGGNQSDSVNVTKFKRDRVLGYRWPEQTIVEYREKAKKGEWTENPPSAPSTVPDVDTGAGVSGSSYPMNSVFMSRAGHIKEIDDTPGNTRLHWMHRSGSYREIVDDGTITDKSVLDRKEITQFSWYGSVGENMHRIIKGDYYNRANGRATIRGDKELFLESDNLIRIRAPRMEFDTALYGPTAHLEDLSVKNDIQGWIKNARYASSAGGLGGKPYSVIFGDIETASSSAAGEFDLYVQDKAPKEPKINSVWVDTSTGTPVQKKQQPDGTWVEDPAPSMKVEVTDPTVFPTDGPSTVVATPVVPNTFKLEDGLIWVNTLTGDVLKYMDGNWGMITGAALTVVSGATKMVGDMMSQDLVDTSMAAYQNSINALTSFSKTQAALDGTVNTFFQGTMPTPEQNPEDGDFWFDTNNNDKMYRYVAGSASWVPDTSEIGALLRSMSELNTGKATTYFQETDPSTDLNNTLVAGDLWFNSAEALQRRWNGTSWTVINNSGDAIAGGTIKGTSVSTNTNTTAERIVVNSTNNSVEYWGDKGDGNIVLLARIGKSGGSDATLFGNSGSTVTAANFVGPVKSSAPMQIGLIPQASAPSAALYPGYICTFYSDTTYVPCYSDGTNWKKISDDSIFI